MKVVRMQVHGCQFLISDLHFGWIKLTVQVRTHPQPRFRGRRPDQIDNDLVALQGTAPPILRNLGKQPMLNLVPLAGTWWIMTDYYVQPNLVRPMLQFQLPE